MLKKWLHFKAFLVPVIFFMVMIQIASFRAPELFSRIHDPYAVLGAQGFEQAGIMNAAWIGFGALVILITTSIHHRHELSQAITYPLIVFGITIIFIGIWQTDNVYALTESNIDEVEDHILFYWIAKIAITLCVLIHAILTKSKRLKWIHILFSLALILTVLSGLLTTEFAGLVDRLLWVLIMTWLLTLFGRVQLYGNNQRL
ncbi:MAG: DUF998 domain-containing protein [Acholeplasmataceae bacterium]